MFLGTTSTKLSSTTVPLKNTTVSERSTKAPYICEEDIALISEAIDNGNKSLVPRFSVAPRTPYKPTDINPGELGLSFPSSDQAYIIVFPISTPATIKSIRLPNTTNVDQIRIMFLDEQDKPIENEPSDQFPIQITSKLETSPTIDVNILTKIYAIHIAMIHTSDGQPPHNVTMEIIICVEPVKTTQNIVETSTTPSIHYTAPPPCKDMM